MSKVSVKDLENYDKAWSVKKWPPKYFHPDETGYVDLREYLNPCPFCGKENIRVERANDGMYSVYCTGCEVQFGTEDKGKFKTPNELVYMWNVLPNIPPKHPRPCNNCQSDRYIEARLITHWGYYMLCTKCGYDTATGIAPLEGHALDRWNKLNSI